MKKKSILDTDVDKAWKNWPYKNTTLLVISLIVFFYLIQTPQIDSVINRVGDFGYIGAFIAGALFVSTFTITPAAVILFHLATKLHPVEVALLAGLGSMVGDYIIFRFFKDRIFGELAPIFSPFHKKYLKTMFRSPYFSWLLPFIGAVVIASPFPDEAGITLLGASKIRPWQFLLLTYILNTVGIFFIVVGAQIISK